MDLTKMLKPGDKVYSLIHGKMVKIKEIDLKQELPIKIDKFSFNASGSVLPGGKDCLLFPSAAELTWVNYCPFKKGDVVVVSDIYNEKEGQKQIRVFSHKENGQHYVFSTVQENGDLEMQMFTNCDFFDRLEAATNAKV